MTETVSEKLAPAYNAVSDATHTIASRIASLTIEPSASTDSKNCALSPRTANVGSGEQGWNNSPHTYDKGVSVKEYLMQKLEPGDNERALSEVITDAISPRNSSGEQVGMMGKMKEAVNSFLRADDSSSISPTKTANQNSSSKKTFTVSKTFTSPRDPVYNASTKNPTPSNPGSMKSKSFNGTTDEKLSSYIPVSTTSNEVTDTENHGRILQAN